MSGQSARVAHRRPARGGVLVYRLDGGPSFRGTLADIGSGGARLIVDRSLDSGEVIRLVFPRKGGEANQPGRMIVGQVVHSRDEPGGHVIRVAFGWDAAVGEPAQAIVRQAGPTPWFRRFWKKATSRTPAVTGRR